MNLSLIHSKHLKKKKKGNWTLLGRKRLTVIGNNISLTTHLLPPAES